MKAFRHERGIEAVFSSAARVAGRAGKVLPTYGHCEHGGREYFPAAVGGRRHGFFIKHGYFIKHGHFIAEARP